MEKILDLRARTEGDVDLAKDQILETNEENADDEFISPLQKSTSKSIKGPGNEIGMLEEIMRAKNPIKSMY